MTTAFFDSAPQKAMKSVARHLQQLDKKKLLAVPEPEAAAEQFLALTLKPARAAEPRSLT